MSEQTATEMLCSCPISYEFQSKSTLQENTLRIQGEYETSLVVIKVCLGIRQDCSLFSIGSCGEVTQTKSNIRVSGLHDT